MDEFYHKPDWDDQFRESEYEVRERWRKTKAKRIAEGKCWQCAQKIEVCQCPNIDHGKPKQQPLSKENQQEE